MKILQKLKNNEFKKNVFILISGNGIAQIIPLLIYPLITRLYSPDAFGFFAFVTSIHNIIITISTGRFDSAIILPKENKVANQLFNIGTSISICIVFLTLLFAISYDLFIPHKQINNNLMLWVYLLTITVFANSASLMFNGWCTRLKLFKIIVSYTVFLNILTSVFRIIFGILEIKDGLLFSFILSLSLSTVFIAFLIKQSNTFPQLGLFKRDLYPVAKTYINFLFFTTPRSLINALSSNLPIFLLTTFFSNETTGQFSIAFLILFRPILIYNTSVSQVLMQRVVELKNTSKPLWPIIKKFIIRTFLVSLIPAILLLVLSPTVFPFILGKEYKVAGIFCSFMIPWAIAVFTGGSIAFIPSILFKQKQELIIDIIYIILRVVALSIGIYFNNVLLGIGLFSLCGVIVIGYQIIWYRQLLKRNDYELIQKK